jgi:SOS-response transcriptional repressor LexA
MNQHVNGWRIIAKWMGLRGKRQSELAKHLKVSQSAVSQIKKGDILLSPLQIYDIIQFLSISNNDVEQLYTDIFNSRMNVGSSKKAVAGIQKEKYIFNVFRYQHGNKVPARKNIFTASKNVSDEAVPVKSEDIKEIPIISFAQAAGYEPALEPFDDFARGCSDNTAIFLEAKPGCFALKVEGDSMSPEYPHGTILLVAGGEYPQRGDIVVAKLRSGQVVVKHYHRQNNIITLESENPDGKNFQWHCKEDPGFIQWMYPVLEVTLKLRNRRWERHKAGV